MVAPSKLAAAKSAQQAKHRTRLMAQTMRHHASGPEEGCTRAHLQAAGFTEAEIEAYRDDACHLMRGTPPVVLASSLARQEGARLVEQAKVIRARVARGTR